MDEKIGGDVVSAYTGKIDTTQLVSQFQKIVDNKFARFIMKRMTTPKKFEHVLGVFAGVEESESIREEIEVKTIESALKRAMKTFGIEDLSIVRNALKEPF
ncbi:MAG: hypothetical protein QXL95_01705, partial [Thermoplasmata archaeon]